MTDMSCISSRNLASLLLESILLAPTTENSGVQLTARAAQPADAVAKRYRPWPQGLRTDSLPWFDSPLVQGASRLRYTDKAQVAATGPYWPKGARNKKKTARAAQPERVVAFLDLCLRANQRIY